MKNCYKFKSLISNYIDKEISFRERKFFESHLSDCTSCEAIYSSITATKAQMQNLPKIKVSDDFMKTLRAKILTDRNSKILASQASGFSLKKLPLYTYALSSLMIVVIVGFTMMKMSQWQKKPTMQLPIATQEKIDDTKNFQQKFDATPSHIQNNLVDSQIDSSGESRDKAVKEIKTNLNKVGYQKK